MIKIKFIGNHAGKFPLEIEGTKPAQYRELRPGDTAEVSDEQAERLMNLFPRLFEFEKEFQISFNKRMTKGAQFKSK